MGDTGRSCAKTHITAHLPVAENSKRRKSWEWFPKNPRMQKGGGVLYNYAAAPHAPTFAISPFQIHPQPSHFRIHIHTCFRHQSLTRSERRHRRRELLTRRRQASESVMMKSGCHRAWGRRSSTDWLRRAFFWTASPPDGGRPLVSPTQCYIPMKL